MVEVKIARELLPEVDLFPIQELSMLLLLTLVRLHLHIDLVLALFDEPVVVLEVEVDIGGKLLRKPIKCSSEVFLVQFLELDRGRGFLLQCGYRLKATCDASCSSSCSLVCIFDP